MPQLPLPPVLFFYLHTRLTATFSSLLNSYRHFLVVPWRTGAWHWWRCKQYKIRRWPRLGGERWREPAVWRDDLSCFQRWRHQSCFESPQTTTVQNLNGWVSPFCYFFHVSNLRLPVGHAGAAASALPAPLLCLCDVAVLVCRGLATLDVLLIDEDLDALLDHADTWVEPGFGLVNDLHTGTWEKQWNARLMLEKKDAWMLSNILAMAAIDAWIFIV